VQMTGLDLGRNCSIDKWQAFSLIHKLRRLWTIALAMVTHAFLRRMASSSVLLLGSPVGLWRRRKWVALAHKLHVISLSSWAHSTLACWMTLLILASGNASSLRKALVIRNVQLSKEMFLPEVSQQVVPNSEVQR